MGEKNTIDLSTFKRAVDEMIVKSDKSWQETLGYRTFGRRLKEYTREEVEKIINSSSVQA